MFTLSSTPRAFNSDAPVADDPAARPERSEASEAVSAVPNAKEWGLDLLRELDWKRFEQVCSDAFAKAGYLVQDTGLGPDYGIDLIMCDGDPLETDCWIAVRCRAGDEPAGIETVCEFADAMESEGYARGVFVTTGRFSPDALESAAKQDGLRLIDGEQFLEGIADFPAGARAELLETAIEGDYATPTCPNCGVKMVKREPGGGTHFTAFWGCPNYGPKNCRVTFAIGEGTRHYSSAIRKRTSFRRRGSGVQGGS